MAIVRKGTLTVGTGGVAQNLALGFYPSYFKMQNYTQMYNSAGTYPATSQVIVAEWYNDLTNGYGYVINATSAGSGAMSTQLLRANAFTPYTTAASAVFPSSNLTITNISAAANASITATHAFTTADLGVTVVTFHNVVGMTQINTLSGVVQTITSTTSFTVNINTTSFTAYSSGGLANIITGIPALQGGLITSGNAPGFPPAQTSTSQVLNAPIYNTSILGLTLGTSLMVNTSDVWEYVAYLDADFTSA